jgi:hypothetical protein
LTGLRAHRISAAAGPSCHGMSHFDVVSDLTGLLGVLTVLYRSLEK